jgi:1,4-alpha-glucan branching enzyme
VVLHSHLPYVRHPEHDDFLEEDWLFEAITETYVPLLSAIERMDEEGVPFRWTIGVTPPLAAMLGDALLISRYRRHLANLRALVEKEVAGHRAGTALGKLARFYQRFLGNVHAYFEERWRGDLLAAFRAAADRGSIELITCTATHGFLPLASSDAVRRAQVRVGVEAFRRVFGRQPRGIWLGECAYEPGVDELLVENGIEYFFLDAHGILHGEPRPVYGVFAPVQTPAGCHAFARDSASSRQVWSSREGYPGDPQYREFYRDLGYDADYVYIRPHLHADGVRRNTGLKYYRVTGDVPLHQKAHYDPEAALARAAEHAGHFLFHRQAQARYLSFGMDRPPTIVAPYDAELFGHWWFEGPMFLEYLARKAAFDQDEIALLTPSDVLERHPRVQIQEPSASTWGAEGFSRVWLNSQNAELYRHQHRAERRMLRLVERFPAAHGVEKEALDQAARELLLLQSSDWAFIVTTNTSVPYAVKRLREHLQRFHALADALEEGRVDGAEVAALRERDAIFPWLDYRVYRREGAP